MTTQHPFPEKRRSPIGTRLRGLFLLAVLLTVLSPSAHAQLDVQLVTAILSGTPGSTVAFTGTLSNQGSTTLFLNGFDYDFGSSGAFFSGDIGGSVPFSLAPSASFTGDLFVIQIGSTTPPAEYTAGVTLSGGIDDQASDVLATPFFQINVTSAAAPEPGSIALLTAGLALVGGLAVRRRAA